MAVIIPFPARTPVPHHNPVADLALCKQWAGEEPAADARRAKIEARIRELLAEATPDPLAQRLAAIEAKLDTLLNKRTRRAS